MKIDDLPKKNKKLEVITFRLEPELFERFKKVKQNSNIDVGEWLRQMLENELDKIGA